MACFAAGAIGAGSGMTCLGWKGGIGTSSRVVDGHVLGALVMTNFGALERLCVNGSPVGRRFAELGRSGEREAPEGSCIVVIATDAPILPAQCERLARRAGLGLARTGSVATHGSGEIFLAFSTSCRSTRQRPRSGDARRVVGSRSRRAVRRGGRCDGGGGARQSVPGDHHNRPTWARRPKRCRSTRCWSCCDRAVSMPVVVAPEPRAPRRCHGCVVRRDRSVGRTAGTCGDHRCGVCRRRRADRRGGGPWARRVAPCPRRGS